jgi:hypothetical protein
MHVQLGEYEENTFLLAVIPTLTSPLPPVADRDFFRLVVVLDENQIPSTDDLYAFAAGALRAGARSIICGGSAAQKVHDAFDDELVYEAEVLRTLKYPENESIPTTWHTDEPLDELLWNGTVFLASDGFEHDQPVIVVVLLEGDPRIVEIEQIGRTMPESLDRVIGRD